MGKQREVDIPQDILTHLREANDSLAALTQAIERHNATGQNLQRKYAQHEAIVQHYVSRIERELSCGQGDTIDLVRGVVVAREGGAE